MKETLNDIGLLVLRVATGAMMVGAHGWGKLAGFAERAPGFADPFGAGPHLSLALATGAEFFCGILVVLGLFTRLALVPLIATMLTIVFIIHGSDPWAKKEFALLYLVPFLSLAFTGPGRFSIDGLLKRKKNRGWQ